MRLSLGYLLKLSALHESHSMIYNNILRNSVPESGIFYSNLISFVPCHLFVQIPSKAFAFTIYIFNFKKKMTKKMRGEGENLWTTSVPIY